MVVAEVELLLVVGRAHKKKQPGTRARYESHILGAHGGVTGGIGFGTRAGLAWRIPAADRGNGLIIDQRWRELRNAGFGPAAQCACHALYDLVEALEHFAAISGL